jgi:FtsH-binding integral membrane protein
MLKEEQMYCPYCRNEIERGINTCPHCGKHLGSQFSFGGGAGVGKIGPNAAAAPIVVDQAPDIARADFVRKTYTHMALAVLAFIILESILLNWSGAKNLVVSMIRGYNWLIVLGVFMGVSWLADKWARSSTSKEMQYAGLGLYVLAEAFIFLPLLYVAKNFVGESVIGSAGFVTLGLFAGLTFVVFSTRKDFSFMRNILGVGSFVALGIIVASIVFGFTLGVLFAGIMVGFAAGAILYTTSNILHHYRTDQYVAAALSLFAAVMLLFWYILQIFMSLDD